MLVHATACKDILYLYMYGCVGGSVGEGKEGRGRRYGRQERVERGRGIGGEGKDIGRDRGKGVREREGGKWR